VLAKSAARRELIDLGHRHPPGPQPKARPAYGERFLRPAFRAARGGWGREGYGEQKRVEKKRPARHCCTTGSAIATLKMHGLSSCGAGRMH
jgi:hypothetical protein